MKTTLVTATLLAAAGFIPLTNAQTSAAPARVVADAPTVPNAPTAAVAPSVGTTTAPNQVVYAPRLPSPQELTDAAGAHGSTITRIEQSNGQVTATYQQSDGTVNVVAYQLLPAGNANARIAPLVTTTPPAVVYVQTPRVIYYDSPRIYDPWYWYPPVSLSIGLGFRGGYGGYYRGGYGHGFGHGYGHGHGFQHGRR